MSTPSPNDTTITPGSGTITDTSGNIFAITGAGTVDMNGNPLGYTANVIKAAYVNGNFWQENSSDLWWEYTGNPSSPWTGLGTSASPIPAGLFEPASPNGTLITPGNGSLTDGGGNYFTITSTGAVDMNGAPLGYTAAVIDATVVNGHLWQQNSTGLWWEYTGNPLAPWTGLGTSTSPTDSFIMNGGTFNAANETATVQVGGNQDQINLNGNANLTLSQTPSQYPNLGISVAGYGNVLHGNISDGGLVDYSISLASNLTVSGQLNVAGGLSISGPGTLVDDGELSASMTSIDSNVLGTGTMTFTNVHDGAGWAYIEGSSGSGITYDLTTYAESATMTVEHPSEFQSSVDMNNATSLDLIGLSATSYDFKNDLLTLYNGNEAVYQLHLTDQSTTEPIYVTSGTGGVTVGVWSPVLGSAPTGLPQHTAVA
jgi:hypothetical protein